MIVEVGETKSCFRAAEWWRSPTTKIAEFIWVPKRQISEAIPCNERLNSPETAPAAALEQGPERTQEEGATGTGPARVAGHEGLNGPN
jgi:hypothetical protein